MKNLYEKLMSLDESEIKSIERKETELLNNLGAKKLHEFDNVAISDNGELYALEDMGCGSDIIKNGNFLMKSPKEFKFGEKII